MANEIKAEIILDLDSLKAQLKQAEKISKDSGSKISTDLGEGIEELFPKLGVLSRGFNLIALSVTAAIGTIAAAFQAARFGEELTKISGQFDVLTEKFGIPSEALKSGLEAASKGLVDTTDLLKSANKAIVELGENAARLPELFTAAQRASAVFGGEVTDNLERITQAVATQSTRPLRGLGIIIDATKAVKEYADALGVQPGVLSEVARQQAILNAIVAESNRSNAKTKESLTPVTDAFKQFKVALSSVFDEIAKIISKSFVGGGLTNGLNLLTSIVKDATNALTAQFGNGAEKAAAQLAILKEQQADLTRKILENKRAVQSGEGGLSARWLNVLQTDLDAINKRIQQLSGQTNNLPIQKNAAAPRVELAKLFDPNAQIKAIEDFNKNVISLDSERISALQALAISSDDQEKIRTEQAALIEEQRLQKINQLNRDYGSVRVTDAAAFQASIDSINQTAALKTQALNTTLLNTAKNLALQVSQTIAKGVSGAIQLMVQNLLAGQDAFANAGKFFLQLLGNLATQMGETLILAGIGIESLFGLEGAGAIAAGIGLVALGAVLSAFAGGGQGVSGGGAGAVAAASAGTGVGGGIASQSEFQQQQEQKPTTAVQVIVNGSIFNNRETALQIAEIINDGFGANGVRYSTG